ncbi:MAG: hypothetical protein JWM56_727 [Candidatus Peribacteria bacterium]|nr:hypothetical protein [Candidatus Peribacteria bacterium]
MRQLEDSFLELRVQLIESSGIYSNLATNSHDATRGTQR